MAVDPQPAVADTTLTQEVPGRQGGVPALGVSYEGRDPELLSMMLSQVDCIEVAPETMADVRGGEIVLSPDIVAELKNVERDVRIVAHGVSLSIGSHDGWQNS